MIKNTTKLQLASLDAFCNELGYVYNGKFFENDEGNKVKFSRMVELHNGKLTNNLWTTVTAKELTPVKVGSVVVRAGEVYKAYDNRLVEQVYLQQKKNGVIVTQQHMVKFCL